MSWLPEAADWPKLRRERGDAEAHVRDLLPALVNGTLDPSDYGRVIAHLERCAGCRAAQQGWEAIAGAVQASALVGEAAPARVLRRTFAVLDRPSRPTTLVTSTPIKDKAELLPPLPVAVEAIDEWTMDDAIAHAPSTDGSNSGYVHPLPFDDPRPLVAGLSTAAVLVLILVAVVVAIRVFG